MAVQVAERWILARLRNETFFTLAALNARIAALLTDLNDRPMKGYGGASRRALFERFDRPALQPLPRDRYVHAEWRHARVNIDYHVEVDRHYYSVPHALIHAAVEICLTATTVDVLLRGARVWLHVRSYQAGRHTTIPEHMPKAHRAHLEWSPSRLIGWGATIGRHTEALVQALLESRPHPEQGYRSCLGILRLAKQHGPARLDAACARALAAGARSYRHVESILKHGFGPAAPRPRVRAPDAAPPPCQRPRAGLLRPVRSRRRPPMLTEPTLDRLRALRLGAMADAYRTQLQDPTIGALSFDERVGLLVDAEHLSRDNRKLGRRLKEAKLRMAQACLEDLEYAPRRELDRALMRQLATGRWIAEHRNILITGATGVGKTYLACALGQHACRQGYRALYRRLPRFFQELALARADGSYTTLLARLARVDVLILDDWGLAAVTDAQRQDLLEVMEDRDAARSTIITSQLPRDQWHTYLGDPTIADAVLDRLVHNAYPITLKGPSRRKDKA